MQELKRLTYFLAEVPSLLFVHDALVILHELVQALWGMEFHAHVNLLPVLEVILKTHYVRMLGHRQ